MCIPDQKQAYIYVIVIYYEALNIDLVKELFNNQLKFFYTLGIKLH